MKECMDIKHGLKYTKANFFCLKFCSFVQDFRFFLGKNEYSIAKII
jgi:hypothetical protein